MPNLLRRLSSFIRPDFDSYVVALHKHNCEDHGCRDTPSLDEAKRDYRATPRSRSRLAALRYHV